MCESTVWNTLYPCESTVGKYQSGSGHSLLHPRYCYLTERWVALIFLFPSFGAQVISKLPFACYHVLNLFDRGGGKEKCGKKKKAHITLTQRENAAMALRARIQARLVLACLYEVAGVVPKVHTRRGLSSAMAFVASKEPSSSLGRPVSNLSPALSGFTQQLRPMTTFLAALPDIKDTRIWNTLNALLGGSWLNIDPEVAAAVESVLAGKSEDNVGKEALATAWRSAKAVETFGGGLSELLMEVSDISGSTGEDVNPLPESTQKAVEAALGKYVQYLDSFDEESEAYLKKKVENDLGSLLVQIKQRFSSTDPKWSKITLLGTTGISGSYVERRSFVI